MMLYQDERVPLEDEHTCLQCLTFILLSLRNFCCVLDKCYP
ncbi:hypothetical protein ABIB60_004245 [Hymenobacter sp. UYP22]